MRKVTRNFVVLSGTSLDEMPIKLYIKHCTAQFVDTICLLLPLQTFIVDSL